jgi:hypothetical protein
MTLSIELEQEVDGRWIAAVAALPGVLRHIRTGARINSARFIRDLWRRA